MAKRELKTGVYWFVSLQGKRVAGRVENDIFSAWLHGKYAALIVTKEQAQARAVQEYTTTQESWWNS